jgi:secretion/DNA translocation related TadE-like protein
VIGRGHPGPRSADAQDRGSASIWVLTCAALVLVVGIAVVLRTGAVLARHRGDGAADAAALAAATQIGVSDSICPSAQRIAVANGATLLSCVAMLAADGRSGSVEVQVGVQIRLPVLGAQMVTASARAGRAPG